MTANLVWLVGPLLASAATLSVLVLAPYVVFERRYRPQWRKLSARRASAPGGPYRNAIVSVQAARRAPFIVRAAALACFFLGVGCVPAITVGFAMLVDGELFGSFALLWGLVLARLWIAGAHLLDPDVDAIRAVRTAARWLLHLSIPVALASVPLWILLSVMTREGMELSVALGACSLAALAHALLLGRATFASAQLLSDEAGKSALLTPAVPRWMLRVVSQRTALRISWRNTRAIE